jgi:ribonucleoside-diphosphate reductase alpha chain
VELDPRTRRLGPAPRLPQPEEKDTFKTSFEIDQRWLLEFAGDRTPYIDQAQSLNLFIPADVEKWDLMMLHFQAWEKGIKSLYYLRSKSVQRAGFAGGVEADNTEQTDELAELQSPSPQDRTRRLALPRFILPQTDYEECLAPGYARAVAGVARVFP